MKPLKPRKRVGPEAKIQQNVIAMLRQNGWHVMQTHGNMFQQGFPDLYCVHKEHGQRWVEIKNPTHYSFTKAQKIHFPIIGVTAGIWILTAATEAEYRKLFQEQNWYHYL